MTIDQWLAGVSDQTIATLVSVGNVDGVPNVARVHGKAKRPLPNGFNSWDWMIPLDKDGQMTGGDNPYAFVWGLSWFEFVDEYHDSDKIPCCLCGGVFPSDEARVLAADHGPDNVCPYCTLPEDSTDGSLAQDLA